MILDLTDLNTVAANLLKDFNLRSTQCRADVIAIFHRDNMALSHADLEKKLKGAFDRVTLYRTLKTFVDRGILHKVLDENGTKYALCKDNCTFDHHDHQHVHFKCLKCGNTQCIENIDIPAIKLPKGYSSIETNFLIEGICKECS